MRFHGFRADVQVSRDIPHFPAGADQLENLQLTIA